MRLKFDGVFAVYHFIWVFLLNNFSRVINLLLTKLARDRTGRISALGLSVRALGPYCQDLGAIFSQDGPRAWLIRYIYKETNTVSYSVALNFCGSKVCDFCVVFHDLLNKVLTKINFRKNLLHWRNYNYKHHMKNLVADIF